MTLVFDSHSFVKRLTAAGMPEAQAEALAGEHTRWFDNFIATKADLAPLAKTVELREVELRLTEAQLRLEQRLEASEVRLEASELRMDARLGGLESRLEARIESTKSEILKWIIGTIGLQTLAVLGAIVALAKSIH